MKTNTQAASCYLGLMCQSSIHALITQLSIQIDCSIQEASPITFPSAQNTTIQRQFFTGSINNGTIEISLIPIDFIIGRLLAIPAGIDVLMILDGYQQKDIEWLKCTLKNLDPVKGVFELPILTRTKMTAHNLSLSPMKMRKIAVN